MRLPSWLRRAPPPPATPQLAALSTADLIATWERIIIGDAKHWVLFRHGTCVVLVGSPSGLSERALEILREWGPVHVGTPAADFNILTLLDHPGWVVTCHHPDVLSYVDPAEVGDKTDDFTVGLYGRSKRDEDAKDLEVVHVHVAQVNGRADR